MSNKRLDHYIPKAIKLIGGEFKTGISSEKKAYITSFGPTVITAGLRNTMMLYETKKEKKFIVDLLDKLIDDESIDSKAIKMRKFNPKIQEIYLDAITALKLASRILPEKEDEDQ